MSKTKQVFGWGTRESAIRKWATDNDIPDVQIEADFLDAIAKAQDTKSPKIEPILVGCFVDWSPPADPEVRADTTIWLEAILQYLTQQQVQFVFLDTDQKVDLKITPQAQTIRRYVTVMSHLQSAVMHRRKCDKRVPKHGRPPYGYRRQRGTLEIDPLSAEAVRLIFRRVREQVPTYHILRELGEKFPTITNGTKKQFWDYVKIRRVLEKAPLYCFGRFGDAEAYPQLAFLPADWVDTIEIYKEKDS